jgi:hypothetical protein
MVSSGISSLQVVLSSVEVAIASAIVEPDTSFACKKGIFLIAQSKIVYFYAEDALLLPYAKVLTKMIFYAYVKVKTNIFTQKEPPRC